MSLAFFPFSTSFLSCEYFCSWSNSLCFRLNLLRLSFATIRADAAKWNDWKLLERNTNRMRSCCMLQCTIQSNLRCIAHPVSPFTSSLLTTRGHSIFFSTAKRFIAINLGTFFVGSVEMRVRNVQNFQFRGIRLKLKQLTDWRLTIFKLSGKSTHRRWLRCFYRRLRYRRQQDVPLRRQKLTAFAFQ